MTQSFHGPGHPIDLHNADRGAHGGKSAAVAREDFSLKAWAFDPALVDNVSTTITTGTSRGVMMRVQATGTISNILMILNDAGSGLTSGQNFAALYRGNVLLPQTVDQSTAWASAGLKIMALATPQAVVAGEFLKAILWMRGTTSPNYFRGAGVGDGAYINPGIAASPYRFFVADTGLTTTAPATLGTQTVDNQAWWIALS